jgi:rubrerythrin
VQVEDLGGIETSAGADASRRRFLKLAAPVAAGGLAAFLSACGSSSDPQTADAKSSDAQAPTGGQDFEIVNFALQLEYIERDFYDQVVSAGLFSGAEGDLFKLIQENEHEHVDALTALAKKLDGRLTERPQTNFPVGSGRSTVLGVAATLESTGVAAYLGQADAIENREVLAAALSIHSVEARHSAQLNRLTGTAFSPDGAFASPLNMDEVNSAIQPFVV